MSAPFWINATFGAMPIGPVLRGLSGARTARALAAERFGLQVDALAVDELDDDYSPWVELSARAIEPNAFFECGFALSASRHFLHHGRPQFVGVWRNDETGRRLVGLFPTVTPGGGDNFTQIWLHKQAALATPLVDRAASPDVFGAYLDWLEAETGAAGALFPRIPAGGPALAALMEAARRHGRAVQILEQHARAALYPGETADDLWQRAAHRKGLKELQRRQRRLQEMGAIGFRQFRRRDEIRDATEQFLSLEASGWKAERGAFLSDPTLATFVRSATRLLAAEGKCQIYSLTLDEQPIAMTILIESQGRSCLWKIAYDERYRSQAPGVQLVYHVTSAQLARPEVDLTDSCAIANHPMIDHVWPDRVEVADVAVQLRSDAPRAFEDACAGERRRRQLRALAKRAVGFLGRKMS